MTALMVQGASSWAGKSLVTTALARALRRRGVDVAPFKAVNMSNNARVVAGGEIGAAQYLQALAAGLEPDVRMNPVLIKPEGDDRSQVIVDGRPDLGLSRMSWTARGARLWQAVAKALHDLLDAHELVLIEGAGSPAEINLRDSDLANMRVAREAGARVLLVADINRGGAFAHLYGTWALLPEDERALLHGFMLNKFRGDQTLLGPGTERLHELTGIPVLGVLPWLEHALPDEDGAATPPPTGSGQVVAVVRYPTASNLDEFKPLEQLGVLRWATTAEAVEPATLVVLPGSKHVAADLAWLRRTGLADVIRRRAQGGRPVLAICGGLQMLGQHIHDAAGVDGSARGLGLLALETTFHGAKRAERTTARFEVLPDRWAMLSGRTLRGYQIRHGDTISTGPLVAALPDGLGFVDGPVLAIYLHGLFEQPELVQTLFGDAPGRSLEQTFEELADAVEDSVDVGALVSLGQVTR